MYFIVMHTGIGVNKVHINHFNVIVLKIIEINYWIVFFFLTNIL